jgi:hypothetical protein
VVLNSILGKVPGDVGWHDSLDIFLICPGAEFHTVVANSPTSMGRVGIQYFAEYLSARVLFKQRRNCVFSKWGRNKVICHLTFAYEPRNLLNSIRGENGVTNIIS